MSFHVAEDIIIIIIIIEEFIVHQLHIEDIDACITRGKIIRTALCCIVYDSCVQWYTHMASSHSGLLI